MRPTENLPLESSNVEAEIARHFRLSGGKSAAETAVLNTAISLLTVNGKKVTSKAIIIYLITELESTSDPRHLDVLRGALEIMVGRTAGNDTV